MKNKLKNCLYTLGLTFSFGLGIACYGLINSSINIEKVNKNDDLSVQYKNNGIKLTSVENRGSNIQTFKYEVLPASATNKTINVSINWKNPNSEFAKDKNANDYITTTIYENSQEVDVKCLDAFGEQIVVLLSSESNPEATAEVTCDYLQKFTNNTVYKVGSTEEENEELYDHSYYPVIKFNKFEETIDLEDICIGNYENRILPIKDYKNIPSLKSSLEFDPIFTKASVPEVLKDGGYGRINVDGLSLIYLDTALEALADKEGFEEYLKVFALFTDDFRNLFHVKENNNSFEFTITDLYPIIDDYINYSGNLKDEHFGVKLELSSPYNENSELKFVFEDTSQQYFAFEDIINMTMEEYDAFLNDFYVEIFQNEDAWRIIKEQQRIFVEQGDIIYDGWEDFDSDNDSFVNALFGMYYPGYVDIYTEKGEFSNRIYFMFEPDLEFNEIEIDVDSIVPEDNNLEF